MSCSLKVQSKAAWTPQKVLEKVFEEEALTHLTFFDLGFLWTVLITKELILSTQTPLINTRFLYMTKYLNNVTFWSKPAFKIKSKYNFFQVKISWLANILVPTCSIVVLFIQCLGLKIRKTFDKPFYCLVLNKDKKYKMYHWVTGSFLHSWVS